MRDSPGPTWIIVVLGVLASVLSIADAVSDQPIFEGTSAVLHALFYLYAAGSLMVYILADRQVTTDELYAVGATFTLVAWAFAYVYVVAAAGLARAPSPRRSTRRRNGPGWSCSSSASPR